MPALPIAARRPTAPVDVLPPHSIESEQGVIGCILQNSGVAFTAIEESRMIPDWFYDARNRIIYEAAWGLHQRTPRLVADLISVQQVLKEDGLLESVGGIAYLNVCWEMSPSAHNVTFNLETLQQKWRLRNIARSLQSALQKVFIANANVDELIEEVQSGISVIEQSNLQVVLDGKGAGGIMVEDLERRFNLQGKLAGISTGFRLLDHMTEGFQPGEHTVIGARPSQGKTALGLTIMSKSLWAGIPCLFVSLEMSVAALMRRMCAMKMRMSLASIRHGTYSESDMKKFQQFQILLNKAPFHVHDAVAGCGIREIASSVNRLVLKHGIKLVIVDYMQKIRPSEKHEKRNYEVADVSGRLKAIAHHNNIHVVTLAQLNRENVKTSKNEHGREPRLSDLADSGQIERDADVVCLIHRNDSETKLIVAKQRDGETGCVPLYFNKEHVEFWGMDDESEEP